MTHYELGEETRTKLMRISTASIATALFKRGLRNQFIQGVVPVSRKPQNMVGQAFTLRYIPAREDRNQITVFRNEDHPQRQAIEQCPAGHVLVMDSRQDARAASAGSILITRLQVRGAAGVVTDGGFRDAEGIGALDMPAYHARPSAPTNLTLHEALDINVPIGCGGAPVFPGDVIVGDGDGVIVIPAHLADEIATECAGMEDFETFVLESVEAGHSIIGLYPPTRRETEERFAKWLNERSRPSGD
ncbi:MAG: ribonuclease activity regulator RraA [Hyphomicrobiaceae bacterium]|nr:ribonuclease activity regulator RraA [Hyphomicrobiaceae bacterium]MCC0022813.1 ribonuclease activity regulator RraA [Hyphomicrobiaceae bacterium]